MKVVSISSHRMMGGDPSWKIVYEWENILSDKLGLEIIPDTPKMQRWFYSKIERLKLTSIYHFLLPHKNLTLRYISITNPYPSCRFNKNTIPVIIDYWVKDEDISTFFKCFRHVPLMLVTNKEVEQKLLAHNPPFPVSHWGLSCPDQYAFDKSYCQNKKIEFSFIGRPNPFFIRLIEEYSKRHPDFIYVYNNGDINNRQYIDNKGNFVAKDTGRESYIEMIRKTKISCYTTPGLDESKKETSEFNQVTPRVFEMLCNGCQVIGHYPKAADTEWYDLASIIPNVDNYEQFEKTLNAMRQKEIDANTIQLFMEKHYTSVRAIQLLDILNKYNINLNLNF